jgi:hypothetical protein
MADCQPGSQGVTLRRAPIPEFFTTCLIIYMVIYKLYRTGRGPCKEASIRLSIRTDLDSFAAPVAARFSFTAPISWDLTFTVFGKGRTSSFTCPGSAEKICPKQSLCAHQSLNHPRVTRFALVQFRLLSLPRFAALCLAAPPLAVPAYKPSLHFAHSPERA